MSISEMERFAKDLQNDEAILEEVRDVGTDNQAVVRFANAKGYDFTLEEVEAIVAKSGELSDEQLESVAGGSYGVFLSGLADCFFVACSKHCIIIF